VLLLLMLLLMLWVRRVQLLLRARRSR
jgi:hypothetical protein